MFKKICANLIAMLILTASLTACVGADDGGKPPAPSGKSDLLLSPPQFVNYCERSEDGRTLLVHVKNAGTVDAASAEVQVDFFIASGSSKKVNGTSVTGVLGPNEETIISVPIPMECFNPDCDFQIIVDPSNAVPESNETNNKVDGSCLG